MKDISFFLSKNVICLDAGVIALLEAMCDEHDTVLDKARNRDPELSVDNEIFKFACFLELPLINSSKYKVKNKQTNKAKIKKKN